MMWYFISASKAGATQAKLCDAISFRWRNSRRTSHYTAPLGKHSPLMLEVETRFWSRHLEPVCKILWTIHEDVSKKKRGTLFSGISFLKLMTSAPHHDNEAYTMHHKKVRHLSFKSTIRTNTVCPSVCLSQHTPSLHKDIILQDRCLTGPLLTTLVTPTCWETGS